MKTGFKKPYIVCLIQGNHKKSHTTTHGTSSVPDKRAPGPKIRGHAFYPTKTTSANTHKLSPLAAHFCALSQHKWSSIDLYYSLQRALPRSPEGCVPSCTFADNVASSHSGFLRWLSLYSWFSEPPQKPPPAYTPHAWLQECCNHCFLLYVDPNFTK
jgi:hypothetical protein